MVAIPFDLWGPMTHVYVFLLAAAIDALWVLWFRFAAERRAALTALISITLAYVSIAGIGAVLRDAQYTLAYVLGFGVGTYVTVRWFGGKT